MAVNWLVTDMATALESSSIAGRPGSAAATASGWTIGCGFMTPSPDKMVGIFDTGGLPNEQVAPLDRPTFQIRVRGAQDLDVGAVRTQLEACRTTLEAINATVVASRRYVMVMLEGNAIPMGPDSNNRQEMVMNFKALRSRSS